MDLSQLSDEELMRAAGPVSVRNNNPGNIRADANSFRSYDTPDAGLQAMRDDLTAKVTGRSPAMASRFGANYQPTLANLITTYAPPSENDTAGYIGNVAKATGLNPNAPLTPQDIDKIMPAMIKQEGGDMAANYYTQAAAPTVDYSTMSDDDLMKAAGMQAEPSANVAEMGNDKGGAQSFVQGFNSAVPFGNRITAGLAAAALGQFAPEGISTSDLYRQARDDQRVTEAANPNANTAGAITGIAATLPVGFSKAVATTPGIGNAANALTTTSKAAGNFIRGGASTLGKAARSAVVAAPAGAVYGYGNSSNDLDTSAAGKDALTGAGLAAATGFALPVAGAAIKEVGKESVNAVRGAFARSGDKLDDAGSALFKESSAAYKKMRDIGATINQPGRRDIGKKIEDALLDDGPLNQGLHGNTLSVVEQLKTEMGQADFSLEKLDQYRRLLSRIPRTTPEDVRKAQIVIGALDDAVENIGISSISKGGKDAVEALTQARAAYTKASKFDRVKELLDASGGDANKLKRSLERAFQNDKFTRGFNADELDALEYAARNSTTEGLLKLGGKFGIDLGSSLSVGNAGLPALFGAASAATSGVGTAGLGIAAGTVARQGQKYVARGKADQLLKVIERGGKVSPKQLQSIPPAMLKQSIQNNSITLPQLQQAFEAKKGTTK